MKIPDRKHQRRTEGRGRRFVAAVGNALPPSPVEVALATALAVYNAARAAAGLAPVATATTGAVPGDPGYEEPPPEKEWWEDPWEKISPYLPLIIVVVAVWFFTRER